MNDKILTIGNSDGGSDEMEVTYFRDGFTFQIEEPYAGSTETGFGQTTSIRVSLRDAAKLAFWLMKETQQAIEEYDAENKS